MKSLAAEAVRTVRLPWTMTDRWDASTDGTFLDARHYDPAYLFRGEAVDVLKPDGRLLLALRPGAVPAACLDVAYPALLKAARVTNNRQTAQGGAAELYSGKAGFHSDGQPTAFTRDEPEAWDALQVLLRAMARAFRDARPVEYADLKAAADRAPAAIPFTPFTAAAVNRWDAAGRNARMATHQDNHNVERGYGVLTAVRSGDFTGGLLVFPKFRAAVDLRPGDLLVADNQERHANTAIEAAGDFERISVVGYAHD